MLLRKAARKPRLKSPKKSKIPPTISPMYPQQPPGIPRREYRTRTAKPRAMQVEMMKIDQAETDVRQIKSYLLHLTINSILLFLKFKKPLKISIF